ncbi:MAG: PolC-type DNA polymerase III [Clostridiales bacterium]|nr:PolC-type DNA polymerase III [Clostridiales bacterium]
MDSNPWPELLKNMHPTEDDRLCLEAWEVKEIKISQESQTWEIALYGSLPPTETEERQILLAMQETFGHGIAYRLCFHKEESPAPLSELFKNATEAEIPTSFVIAEPEEEEALLNQRLEEKNKDVKGKKKTSATILGRKISGQARMLSDLVDESINTVIDAMVFRVNEQKLLNAGTLLCDFDLTDYTGSIKAKLFVDQKNQKRLKQNWLKEGAWYRMKGSARMDSFQKELVFYPDDIAEGEERTRRDQAPVKRVELHLHTKLSAMDALVSPKALIQQLVAWGHEAVAITDHGVVQAFPEAMKEAAAARGKSQKPFKVLYGMEGYLIDSDTLTRDFSEEFANDGERNAMQNENAPGVWHIVLLAKNKTGIKNLYQLVSLSHLDYFYKRPRIPRNELIRLREGLLVGSACEAGEFFTQVLNGADDRTLEATASFYDYLEIQPVMNNGYLIRNGSVAGEEALQDLNRKVLAVGRKLGIPVAATGDVHFLLPEDEVLRRILQAGQKYKDADIQPPLYMHTTEEMLEEFAYLGEAEAFQVVVEATRAIADQVENLDPIPDKLMTPKLPGAREAVEGMVRRKASELYGDELPEWIGQRLEREIMSITEYGYADLYYIAHKLVRYSEENGYRVGSRGSVGSSLVAFLSGITEVNPLAPHYRCPAPSCKHVIQGEASLYGCGADMPPMDCPVCGSPMKKEGFHIPFEVFLGFEGDKAPDIDLNFSGEFQTQAQKYTEELFGQDHVFKAGTIFTIANKTAYGFVKNYFDDRGKPIRGTELERLVQGLSGVRRTTSQHPGGIVVLPEGDEIINYTPVQRPADDSSSEFVTTHFDYHAIGNCLVKLDILGHDDPTMIRILGEMTGKDIMEISLDDPAVLSLFRSPEALAVDPGKSGIDTGSLGVPEFGTSFVRGMLLDTKPSTFSDLIRISGFSHGTAVWLGNAREILKENLGTMKEVITCRDDIMLTLIQAGVHPLHAFKIMERVRKGAGLSGEDISAMEEVKVPAWYIDSCNKIQYLFPKAHAVAYVTMAFRIAWFKIYEPLAFYAATFTVREGLDGAIAAGGLDRIESTMTEIRAKRERKEASGREEDHYTLLELAREMYLRGFSFLPVHLEKSGAARFLVEDGKLRLPFTSLSGLGLTAAQSIVEAREEKAFHSVEDLRQRAKIGVAMIALLQEQGALGDLPESNQQSMFS